MRARLRKGIRGNVHLRSHAHTHGESRGRGQQQGCGIRLYQIGTGNNAVTTGVAHYSAAPALNLIPDRWFLSLPNTIEQGVNLIETEVRDMTTSGFRILVTESISRG